jgi:hypothetical protein
MGDVLNKRMEQGKDYLQHTKPVDGWSEFIPYVRKYDDKSWEIKASQ